MTLRYEEIAEILKIIDSSNCDEVSIEIGEIKLFVRRVEGCEQVEHFVDHFGRARVRLVDLVHADDGFEADFQRLAEDELSLRHRPFGGVHKDDRPVHHGKDALDLAAEIGVARRVDDVDPNVLPHDRGCLGEDGDAALALEVVRIHDPFGDPLVVAKRA